MDQNERETEEEGEQERLEPIGGQPIAPRWGLAATLLIATLCSTMFTGLTLADIGEVADPASLEFMDLVAMPQVWMQGASYALSLMAILFVHEMGHYLPARRYGVEASLPYFLPGFPPFGTFGAFIRMGMGRISASRLFRIGAGGPFAGFAVALPVLIIGLMLSDVRPVPAELEGASLGDSILMWGVTRAMFGALPAGHDVFLHPMAYAGWVGMFVTSFNLVPLGQLDGGHIAFTLFGERFNKVAWFLLVGLIILGVVTFPGWLVLVLFLIFLGPTHPNVTRGEVLKGPERLAGYAGLLLFVLTFVPKPFEVPSLLGFLLE